MANGIEAIVIGGSAGALEALGTILSDLSAGFSIPIAIVLHLPPSARSGLVDVLQLRSSLLVKEVEDKEPMASATIYVAPANYHVLIEKTRSFALSVDEPVRYSRPAIDVLFETAAEAFGQRVAGLLLTGANDDGARGLLRIQEAGGMTIVQSPETAYSPTMPHAALRLMEPNHIVHVHEIGALLSRLRDNSGQAAMEAR